MCVVGGWQNAMMFQKELSYEFSLKKRLLRCSNLSLVVFKREILAKHSFSEILV